MGKARMYGAYAPYTPNSKADMRYRRKVYEKKKEFADNAGERAALRRELKQLEELERMKREAYCGT